MENLRKFFKKLDFRTDGRLFGFGTSPEADWKIIFVSTMILVVSLITLSVFIFIKVEGGGIFATDQTSDEVEKTLDIAYLKKTVSYYQNKAREFERIKSTKMPYVDPSL